MAGSKQIVLNIRGRVHKIGTNLIDELPDAAPFTQNCKQFIKNRISQQEKMGESEANNNNVTGPYALLEVDRDPVIVCEIFEFLQGHKTRLHLPEGVCVSMWMEELAFFGLDGSVICQLCKERFLWQEKWAGTEQKALDWWKVLKLRPTEDVLPGLDSQTPRFVMVAMVLASLTTLWFTPSLDQVSEMRHTTTSLTSNTEHHWKSAILVDLLLTSVIALENAIRFCSSKNKMCFITSPLNVIECFSWASTWLQFGLVIMPYFWNQLLVKILVLFLTFGKLFRVIPIFRFITNTAAGNKLKLLAVSVFVAWKDFLVLLGLAGAFSLLVGLVTFYCNNGADEFATALETVTWAFVTVFTVGYGATYVSVTGVLCAYVGILLVALCVHVVCTYYGVIEFAVHSHVFGAATVRACRAE